ncbi:MAG: RNA polymerase sigma-70 factor [Bacteroidetes bacterium]|nr:MAG: RNA polymerase sigma-70 factor [Bacteroidota bacterium]
MQEASASTLTAQVNDKALVEQFINGNEKAFETLFKRYYQMLRKVAQYMLDDLEQAEELVQDAFVNIWEKRSNVNPDASFKNYLITAVRNRCLNHIKAKKKTHSIDDDEIWQEQLVADSRTEAAVNFKEMHRAIEQAIDKLPEQCRIIFQLSRHEGLSYKEIAEALDIAPKTVENQIGRALKVLKVELKEYFPLFLIFFN